MVLYFSGTGNSRYVAERIAEKTGDELVSLNHLLKNKQKDALASPSHPFVFVCPTYAWRIPRVVEQYIKSTPFEGTKQVYFVLTCGGETAGAKHYAEKLCEEKGWQMQGFAEILMPDNYIVMFPALEKEKEVEKNHKADELIDRIADSICQGKSISLYTQKGMLGTLQSKMVNSLFYPFYVKAKGFYTTEKCIGCGKCVELCPLNNIAMEKEKPVWGGNCTHCMACICGCPTVAIEYKNKTQGKPRYQLSNYR